MTTILFWLHRFVRCFQLFTIFTRTLFGWTIGSLGVLV